MNWTWGALIGTGLVTAMFAGATLVPHRENACEGVPWADSYPRDSVGLIRITLTNVGGPAHYLVCLMDETGIRERVQLMLTSGDDHIVDLKAPPKEVIVGIAHGGGLLMGGRIDREMIDLAKCPGYKQEIKFDSRTGAFDFESGATKSCSASSGSLTANKQQAPFFAGDFEAPGSPPLPGWVGAVVLGTAAVIGLGAVAWFRIRGFRIFVLGLFTRLLEPDVLKQETRARILELVRSEPGIYANEIATHLELGHGAADYHLAVLLRSQLVTRVRIAGYRCYFEYGRFAPTDMRRLGILRTGGLSEAFDLVRAHPGLTVSGFADRLAVSRSRASKIIRRLEDAGLVRRRVVGRSVHVDPIG